jgi:hypothetical protein
MFSGQREYYNMVERLFEPELQLAIQLLSVQNPQNQELSRNIQTFPAIGTDFWVPGSIKGESGNPMMYSDVTYKMGLASSSLIGMLLPQSAHNLTKNAAHTISLGAFKYSAIALQNYAPYTIGSYRFIYDPHMYICFLFLVCIIDHVSHLLSCLCSLLSRKTSQGDGGEGGPKGTKVQLSSLHERAGGCVIHHMWPHLLRELHQGLYPGSEKVPYLPEEADPARFPPALPPGDKLEPLRQSELSPHQHFGIVSELVFTRLSLPFSFFPKI